MSSKLHKYEEEIQALTLIYGEDLNVIDKSNKIYSIKIISNEYSDIECDLQIKFIDEYPESLPPIFQINCKIIELDFQKFEKDLINIYKFVRENLHLLKSSFKTVPINDAGLSTHVLSNIDNDKMLKCKKYSDDNQNKAEISNLKLSNKFDIEIITGLPILERKSTFQAHIARVFSLSDVQKFVTQLKIINKKVDQATHNILAYRILKNNSLIKNDNDDNIESKPLNNYIIQDYDDDGETNAGHRLLHLLQLTEAINVAVIVSRWFGGIKLGPDRFKFINNAARDLLSQSGYINSIVLINWATVLGKNLGRNSTQRPEIK
ncbi:unnamed protein product [Gordionus sp. m RMFG-2023]